MAGLFKELLINQHNVPVFRPTRRQGTLSTSWAGLSRQRKETRGFFDGPDNAPGPQPCYPAIQYSGLRAGGLFRPGTVDQGFQFALLIHFNHDVATPYQFSINP